MNQNLERERIRAALRSRPIPIPTLAAQLGVDIAVIELFITTDAILNAELQARLAAILARSEQRKTTAPSRTTASNKNGPIPPVAKRNATMFTARAIKVTLVLDAAQLAALPRPAPETARVTLTVAVEGGRNVTAELNAKSIRKCKNVINEHGPANVALILQGKLDGRTDVIIEAGLVAQVKVQAKEKENVPTPT